MPQVYSRADRAAKAATGFFQGMHASEDAIRRQQAHEFGLQRAAQEEDSEIALAAALQQAIENQHEDLPEPERMDPILKVLPRIKDERQLQRVLEIYRMERERQIVEQGRGQLATQIEQYVEDGSFGESESSAAIWQPILETLQDEKVPVQAQDIDQFESDIRNVLLKEADRKDRERRRLKAGEEAIAWIELLKGKATFPEIEQAERLALMIPNLPAPLEPEDVLEEIQDILTGARRPGALKLTSEQQLRKEYVQDARREGLKWEEIEAGWPAYMAFVLEQQGGGETAPGGPPGQPPAPGGPGQDLNPQDVLDIQSRVEAMRQKPAVPKFHTAGAGGDVESTPLTPSAGAPGQESAMRFALSGGSEAERRKAADAMLSDGLGKPVQLSKEQHRQLRKILMEAAKRAATATGLR